MKVTKYTLLALGTVAIASASMLSSCMKENPDSPGFEYMPDMYRSPAPEPNSIYLSGATPDSMSNRLPADGSIPRGWTPFPYENSPLGDSLAAMFWKAPAGMRCDSVEEKGKAIYERFCIMCHGAAGDGQGKLVTTEKYGAQPPSYLLRYSQNNLSDGHVYHVITYGKGNMGSHASQLSPEERWNVIMYVQRLGRGGDAWSVWTAKQNAPATTDSTATTVPAPAATTPAAPAAGTMPAPTPAPGH